MTLSRLKKKKNSKWNRKDKDNFNLTFQFDKRSKNAREAANSASATIKVNITVIFTKKNNGNEAEKTLKNCNLSSIYQSVIKGYEEYNFQMILQHKKTISDELQHIHLSRHERGL